MSECCDDLVVGGSHAAVAEHVDGDARCEDPAQRGLERTKAHIISTADEVVPVDE